MKRICAWCNKELSTQEKYVSNGTITHGVCSSCAVCMSTDEPRTAKEILSLVNEPIFIINDQGVVKAANQSAANMVQKEMEDIEDERGGDAFECAYARLEGGCGNTVHCKTCAIRNTVMDTILTGRGYTNVPAYQNINTPNGEKVLRFTISTEKVDKRILLRIDSVDD